MVELKDKIMQHYIEVVRVNGKNPQSVYAFCKECEIEEEDFYKLFSGFESIETAIWHNLFADVLSAIAADDAYAEYNTKEKYLAFCYTLIEYLMKNLSFFRASANEQMLVKLMQNPVIKAQNLVSDYFEKLVRDGQISGEIKTPSLMQKPVSKLIQLHQLFIIRFFFKDKSEVFIETDQAIEKSVRLLFDSLDNSVIESAIDFTKFLGKKVFS